jgi:two-component system, NtrC family, response regulator AtoC
MLTARSEGVTRMDGRARALRVLVVEDELLIRWSLTETLTAAGMTVEEAPDGLTAIRLVSAEQTAPLDVVLLDYRLPDSNDLHLLATIRRLAPRSQVILMTAFGSPEVVEGALALGAWQVVNKPFELAEMTALVADAFAHRPQ